MTDMEYRQLGDSGLTVSVVGLGCNNFGRRLDADRTAAVVNAAVDAGITLFDTADIYRGDHGFSEELLGKALGSRRDEVVIATKFGGDMGGVNGPDWGVRGSRRYIRKAVESSLQRLGTDWIDLYQLHFPDPVTPIEETLAALSELVAEGKVRYLGSSQFAAWQVVDADWTARSNGFEHFVSAQNQYSLLERDVEDELVPACEHLGLGILPFFPLASGLLTGKYKRGTSAPEGTRLATQPERLARADFDRIEALETFAAERDLTMIDVAIGGLAAQPAVASVIAGATTPEQIAQNVAAGSWQPTAADLAALDDLT
ncbi:aldo/keto reductase [Kribbella shirazensis]|jgi:aryl-alcohol dehydrogenase-like predicted oxidoreductase|uniref:Aryl-alcohol dehydrogenase-like predicted oxidoreductase n=1 Tax=Kribbella shirazensis TaxID=1105143 RepID=A0A7X5VE97_9ACTN|nr:aldo/keto reductase [Kribbella shirazensis]NIK59650.1 aryl-alcohol dehydrogenase-like predicted oxidoreductase [Kribbella shirazensis]